MQEQVERLFASYSEELESHRVVTSFIVVEKEESPEESAFPELPQWLALLRPISARR